MKKKLIIFILLVLSTLCLFAYVRLIFSSSYGFKKKSFSYQLLIGPNQLFDAIRDKGGDVTFFYRPADGPAPKESGAMISGNESALRDMSGFIDEYLKRLGYVGNGDLENIEYMKNESIDFYMKKVGDKLVVIEYEH